jgi:hypothetical protein
MELLPLGGQRSGGSRKRGGTHERIGISSMKWRCGQRRASSERMRSSSAALRSS